MSKISLINYISDEKTILNQICNNRSYLMGVAILLIIIYHLFNWTYNPIGPLNMGYMGVDIFFFISGLGLSLSFEKNPISKFYINRLKRIYPIYFIGVSLTAILVGWNIKELINNYLTIGFYVDGGINRYDWYLESLFTVYLLFPILYYLGKYKYYSLLSVFILTTATACFIDIEWWYICPICKLPILLYGIMFRNCLKSIKAICCIGIILFVPCHLIYPYLGSALVAMPTIILALFVSSYLKPYIINAITFCGKYSLEIYCANILMHKALDLYCGDAFMTRFVAFFFFQIFFSFIFVMVRKLSLKFIS